MAWANWPRMPPACPIPDGQNAISGTRVPPRAFDVVRRVHGARGEIEEERLSRRRFLLADHHPDRLVREVLGQVISGVRPGGRLDV
jgi:hypothetical protein